MLKNMNIWVKKSDPIKQIVCLIESDPFMVLIKILFNAYGCVDGFVCRHAYV